MKNWEYIKVGNGSGSWRGKFYEDSAGNSASVEKRGEGWQVYWEDARGYGKPLGTYKDERTAREVAEDAVESEMPDKIREKYKSKAINRKLGNESIDKQEWSMFSGLKKDAEKEIGNRESLVGKYVWVRSKGDEWKCYVLQDQGNKLYIQDTDGHFGWVSIERVTGVVKNKKTGNKSIDDEIKELEKDLKTAQHDLNYMKKYRQDTRGTEMRVKELESQLRLLYSMKSRGFNSKTGNSFDAGSRITIRHNGKEEEVKVLKDMPTSILVKGQSGAVVEIKKTDFEVVKTNNTKKTKTGNRVGKLFTEEERARIALGRYEDAIKRGYGVDYEKKLAKEEIQTLEKIAKGEAKYIGFEEKDIPDAKRAIEIYKKILNRKTGNETKGERKFGKVMGEFEEGALKTPQGKTVTDPDQAKAIAYTEADKVDNLKRARNAMNKKK